MELEQIASATAHKNAFTISKTRSLSNHQIRSQMKTRSLILISLLVPLPHAWCQAESTGSILVAIHSRDEVVLAADSRLTLQTSEQSDDDCKVSALGRFISG